MGRCSYVWREWDREKKKHIVNLCQNEAWKDSHEFQIFHNPLLEKDSNLFKKQLKNILKLKLKKKAFSDIVSLINAFFLQRGNLNLLRTLRKPPFRVLEYMKSIVLE